MKATYITCYIFAVICISIGLHKMYAYKNPDRGSEYRVLSDDAVNAYVGGDAYNFIINAGYSTAFFVLALVFVAFGGFMQLIMTNNENAEKLLEAQKDHYKAIS